MTADAPQPVHRKELSAPQKALHKLGLVRSIDLALHLPLRYEDETRIVRLADAREGQSVQVEGTVTHSEITLRPRRQLLVTLDDGSDTCTLRFFSFYPSHQKALAVGARVRVRGEIRGGFMGRTIMHPAFHAAGGELPNALTPVYPTSAQLPQAYLRKVVASGLARADLSETLPRELLGSLQEVVRAPWTLHEALRYLHQPGPDVSLDALEDRSHPAWQRLKAEELLAQQLSQLTAKRERDALRAPPLRTAPGGLPEQLLGLLPFALTAAQRRVGEEIARDLARPVPMHRLLQGDVGSGKTVVAALAAAIAIDSGWQCALMAPTEILAEQHFAKLIGWLEPLLAPRGKRVAWLTGSQKKKQRTEMLALIASGEAALVVGTHAVIQDQVVFLNLALAIIDEQHRFGVAQRLALRSKMGPPPSLAHSVSPLSPSRGNAGGPAEPVPRRSGPGDAHATDTTVYGEPHLLMMTATPIPRTLAMSYYADLDVSTIDELPPGRTPIVTKVVSDQRRHEVIERIRAQVAQGRQVYWVCPLIEESEALDLSNATATHAELSEELNRNTVAATSLPLRADGAEAPAEPPGGAGVLVGLLHSRMPVAEKKAVMALFSAGHMGVLVSTTVIEVGVDVPNASLMVIEHAERFGLSQLHQLRGRVGRGAAASACVLLYSPPDGGRLSETARERLKAMAETNDGFEIARRDLEIRGPGEFLGARQSGAAMLRFADLATDGHLLDWARSAATQMLAQHPQAAEKHIARWLGTKAEYLKA
ncbi:MAG: ATP-dependent DNA helicase RecG [Hydrogenophaga sp.]|uniref:ATP-dependent DNA helicase RecG n=1 Tax=Hydrogenophaga sp. TaxID=1904254 RepID=UPI001BC34D54|nr:ATP-dependent DNA helicase RecG [Hydrogenophaga sp.]MBS3911254.1 ATP-dependent DNA helicase RecG [Hydrogenophaga sp.]MDO9149633.1 ATP-dependent DNA helicase RecG [Hydrogenophaga sp.]MDO9603233.1 ATP-dependent DNA helicase RecG [Hydrogenophaga sp.]